MLVHDFIQIPLPSAVVSEAFAAPGLAWLAEDAAAAYVDGEGLSLTLRPSAGPVRVGKRVQVAIGVHRMAGDALLIPITWCAVGATRFFPTMDADLEVAPMGEEATMITLMGRYQPPLGAVGRGLDRVVLHRLAAASVRSFLERVAASLGREAARDTRPLKKGAA